MEIVDSQIHIWSSGKPNGAHRQQPVYSRDDALKQMDEAGIAAAVLHPPGWDPNAGAVAVEAARLIPTALPCSAGSRSTPGKPVADRRVEAAAGHAWPAFHLSQPHKKNWMVDGTMDWLWPAAERAGLPVGLAAPNFLPVIGHIAERHPRAAPPRRSHGRGVRRRRTPPPSPSCRSCWRSRNTRTSR